MHQALYRKYRPAVFSDVVGQEQITSVLRYQVMEGRTSHAYLFCGSRGTGKTTCAKILAKAVNCLHPEGGNPCCACENCLAIEKGATSDVLEMDAASNTGVDYIRDIKDAVMYAPAMLKSRVYIIDEVHMLSDGAFNALLKTLEEPPSNVVFILATTEMQKVPATILSRCQHFEFRRISSAVIAERLQYIAGKEDVRLTDDAAYQIARSAQGGMRDAISLFELCSANGQEVNAERVEELSGGSGRKTAEETVRAILRKDGKRIFEIVASTYESNGDLGVFWQELIGYYRDMLVYKTVKGMPPAELQKSILDLTEVEFEQLRELAEPFRYETLLYHSSVLDEALYSVSGRGSAAGRASAEMTLLRLTVDSLGTDQTALLSRIAKLEDRLNSGELGIRRAEEPAKNPAEDAGKKPTEEPTESKQKEQIAVDPSAKPKKPVECPDFAVVLHAYMNSEPGVASFLSSSKAYRVGEKEVCVTVENSFALKMLESRKAQEALERIFRNTENMDVRVTFQITDHPDDTPDILQELNGMQG